MNASNLPDWSLTVDITLYIRLSLVHTIEFTYHIIFCMILNCMLIYIPVLVLNYFFIYGYIKCSTF